MNNNRKIVTQSSILDALKHGQVSLPPLSFKFIEFNPVFNGKYRFDALIEGRWGDDSSAIFVTEIKALSTPKAFMESIAILKAANLPKNRFPLLIMPYLSEKQLQDLEQEGINGLDLCGNGFFNIKAKLTVLRTGKKNRFTSSAPIKNIYRKNSSMIGRAFLLYPEFYLVNEILERIRKRDIFSSMMKQPSLTIGTVSKVLSGMEQDLIIRRGEKAISLLRPDMLLDKLSQNYTGPSAASGISIRANVTGQALLDRLASLSEKLNVPIVATGLSSVFRYTALQQEEKLSVYCPLDHELFSTLVPEGSFGLANLEIITAKDATVYFDARMEAGFYWASPIQTFLELMQSQSHRLDRETGNQVRNFILEKIEKNYSMGD